MDYEIKKLVADGDRILTVDGEYIATVSMTIAAKELLDNAGWEKGKESWIDYKKRTEQERENEKLKRFALVHDLVTAYNSALNT